MNEASVVMWDFKVSLDLNGTGVVFNGLGEVDSEIPYLPAVVEGCGQIIRPTTSAM